MHENIYEQLIPSSGSKNNNIQTLAIYQMFIIKLVILIHSVSCFRISSISPHGGYVDTSNCTWSEWSECGLKPGTYTSCESSRTLELAEDQKLKSPYVIPCFEQAGSIESKPCQDGNCPSWRVGNWSDCSNTCNVTTKAEVWAAMQVRDIQCADARGWFYEEKVCVSIRGQKPMTDKACPCSHQTTEAQPYQLSWNTVGV